MYIRTFIAALVLGIAAMPPPAGAQTRQSVPCGPRDTITDQLTQRYSEHQSGLGVANGTRLFEVWQSEQTGTWTILMTRPDGVSCIMATGRHWRDAPATTVSDEPV